MIEFETSGQLRYIGGFKYLCCEDWWIILPSLKGHSANYDGIAILDVDGKLLIKKGFGCDGASGPTVDTKSAIRGPFVHDAVYAMLRKGLITEPVRFSKEAIEILKPEIKATEPKPGESFAEKIRRKADEVLRDLCIYDGMWKWRAWAWYWAVRKFAFGSARRQERKELLAP